MKTSLAIVQMPVPNADSPIWVAPEPSGADPQVALLGDTHEEMQHVVRAFIHALRSPAWAADGFAHLMEEASRRDLPAVREYVSPLLDSVERTNALLDAMTDFARVCAAEMTPTAFDLMEASEGVFQREFDADMRRRVEFTHPARSVVFGDRTLVERALSNLLRNAVAVTSRNPHPRIELGVAADDGGDDAPRAGFRRFYVRDNGVGFDNALATDPFMPFHPLHAEREYQGKGIGLAVTRRIIHRHGGTIRATGHPGEGATISFSLPVLDGDEAGEAFLSN